MAKGYFKTENAGAGKVRHHINGIVGDWGNASEDVIYSIESQDADEIEVFIQSPGGSAFEGIAIYNALRNHKAHVTTHILGAAASAASLIFMAGDKRVMPKNTYLMIHEPSLVIRGRAKELREAADFLDGITQSLLATYMPHINLEENVLLDMLVKESWIKANAAKDMGFATDLDEPMQAVALSNDFATRFEVPPPVMAAKPISEVIANIQTTKDLERCLRESGCSNALATALVSKAKAVLQSESAEEAEAIFNHLKTFKLN